MPVTLPQLDTDALRDELAGIIQESITDLVQGTADDLAEFGHKIAEDVIRVMAIADAAQRDRLLAELLMQVKLLGEIQRLQASQAAWEIAAKIIGVVAKTAIKLVLPV